MRVDGLKWISSFPENVAAGIPRASAVLILNDHDTGYPFACLESSIISATRTAASAALAADWLTRGRPRPTRVGFFGAGLIARYIHTFLAGTGWSFDEIGVHDLSADSAAGFRGYLEQSGAAGRITVHESAEQLIRSSDLVVFATVAGQPHVSDVSWFDHNPLVLHVSLRDLAPEILLASTNVVDDVEHCLKANTSPHLAEQLTGNRDFLHGTLDDVMAGRVTVPADRPVVFSPFGLGVLDLAVGKYVYDEVASRRRPARHRRFLPRATPVRLMESCAVSGSSADLLHHEDDLGSAARGIGHPDRDQRAALDLRPVTVELQLGQGGGRKATFDRADRLRRGRVGIGHVMHQAWCAWSVSDKQCDMAVVGKIAYGVDQRIGAGVVEALGNFNPIGSS